MSRRRLLVIVGLLLCLQILIGLLIFAIRWPERVPGWGQDGSPTTTTRPAATSTKPPSSQPISSPHPEIEAINQQIKLLRDGQIAYRVLSPMRVNDLHRVTARVAYVLGSKSALPGTGPVTTTSLPVGAAPSRGSQRAGLRHYARGRQ